MKNNDYYPKSLGERNFKALQGAMNKLHEDLHSTLEANNHLRQEVNNLKLEVQNMRQEQNLAKALASNGGPTVNN